MRADWLCVHARVVRQQEEERATGDVLFGDENTHTQELLRERQAAVGRRRQPGMGKAARCHLSARYAVGNVVTHAACRYGIIALILLDMLLFLLEVRARLRVWGRCWLYAHSPGTVLGRIRSTVWWTVTRTRGFTSWRLCWCGSTPRK